MGELTHTNTHTHTHKYRENMVKERAFCILTKKKFRVKKEKNI